MPTLTSSTQTLNLNGGAEERFLFIYFSPKQVTSHACALENMVQILIYCWLILSPHN